MSEMETALVWLREMQERLARASSDIAMCSMIPTEDWHDFPIRAGFLGWVIDALERGDHRVGVG